MKALLVVVAFAILFALIMWIATEIRNSHPVDNEDETFLN